MPKKIILTCEQSNRLIENIIAEGAWENIKYGLSKLIKNKTKLNPEDAAKIEAIISKKGNELIKNIDRKIKRTNPEFPNSKLSVDFLKTVSDIALIYDSISSATKLEPNKYGYLPADMANALIADLRIYVKKFLEIDLNPIYNKVDENTELTKITEGLADDLRSALQIGLKSGDAVNYITHSGSKQSRAQTLAHLYQMLKDVPGNLIPAPGEPTPITPGIKPSATIPAARNVPRATSTEDVYSAIKNLFQFIVDNKKKSDLRRTQNILKQGDIALYKDKKVIVVNPSSAPGRTSVVEPGKKTIYSVDTSALKKVQEPVLQEGRYIRDKRVVSYLDKELITDSVETFEGLMSRVEQLKFAVRRSSSSDRTINGYINKLKSNPIMETDLIRIFNIPFENEKGIVSLKDFIDDLFATLYVGKFKKEVSSLGKISGDNPQSKLTFKKNLLSFFDDAITLFQYLHKEKARNKSVETS